MKVKVIEVEKKDVINIAGIRKVTFSYLVLKNTNENPDPRKMINKTHLK
jgi:hypothetical protein